MAITRRVVWARCLISAEEPGRAPTSGGREVLYSPIVVSRRSLVLRLPIGPGNLAAEGVEAWRAIADVPEGRRFGLIRMNWSLEHVYSPLRYFSFVRDSLETGGRAVIAVPNYDGLIYRLAPDCVELSIHLYHFRPHDIENYAARCGLRVLELRTFSYPQMFVAAAQAGLFPEAFAAQFDVRQASAFQSMLARFDRAGWGNDMIVVLEPV